MLVWDVCPSRATRRMSSRAHFGQAPIVHRRTHSSLEWHTTLLRDPSGASMPHDVSLPSDKIHSSHWLPATSLHDVALALGATLKAGGCPSASLYLCSLRNCSICTASAPAITDATRSCQRGMRPSQKAKDLVSPEDLDQWARVGPFKPRMQS